MTADLHSLLSRVESAEGPDRGLDAAIACALVFPNLRPAEPDDFAGKYGYNPGNIKCEHGFLMSESYTRSIDDAIALKEHVFPGALVENLGEMRDAGEYTGHWLAQLAPRGPRPRLREISVQGLRDALDGWPTVRAPTPALAIVKALLKAKIAENENV